MNEGVEVDVLGLAKARELQLMMNIWIDPSVREAYKYIHYVYALR